ncbi:MAG: YkvA family protein [Marinobacter sp.]|uniref:YkvA family protein n=1 Tax=Marinobacter sp. TaxID=50741 RepID=UPI00299F46B8|nr:YkvA family protein [Marinobacter sp.]MDX1755308.1 YkvA family protein [Marinobacter sp.]
MKPFNQQKAREELQSEADKIAETDLEGLLARQQRIENKIKRSGKLSRFGTDIRLMFDMLRDYWQGQYRAVPWKSIAAIAGALIYVLNPLDLIPDLILGFGLLDDASVVAACLTLVEADLHRYAAWKQLQGQQEP